MPFAALGSLGSAAIGYFGSQSAADKQAQANANALAFQKQVFAQNQSNLNPFIQTGQGADYTLASLYGLGGTGGGIGGASGGTGSPNWAAFFNSPDYQFAFNQGQNATTNLLSAKGNLASGGGLTALTNYGQGMASQQLQNYIGRLQQIANMGVQAGGALAGTNVQSGNQIGNTYGALGTAQASGIMGGANALGGGINNMMAYNYLMNKNPSSYGGSWFGGGGVNTPPGASPMSWTDPSQAIG